LAGRAASEHKTNLKAPKQADSRLIKPGQKMAKSIGKMGSKPQRQRSITAAFVMDMTTKCQAVKTNEAKSNAGVWGLGMANAMATAMAMVILQTWLWLWLWLTKTRNPLAPMPT